MKTMRRVALVVAGCVVASFVVLAWLMTWLGPSLGIVVGLGIAFSLVASLRRFRRPVATAMGGHRRGDPTFDAW
jgi:hypothetical protein